MRLPRVVRDTAQRIEETIQTRGASISAAVDTNTSVVVVVGLVALTALLMAVVALVRR
jgi:CHASE3 domain sensor protein